MLVGMLKRWAILLAITAAIAVGGSLLAPPTGSMCDGSYPEWMIPDDYDGGGCLDVGPATFLGGLLPWNWGARVVCIGLCTNLQEVYVPHASP